LKHGCKRRRGEVGEGIEEESFPLPCHSLPSAGLTPLSSSLKLRASELRREGKRRGQRGGTPNSLPFLFRRQDQAPSR